MTALTVLKIKVNQMLGKPFQAQLNSVKALCIICRQATPYITNMISNCFSNLVRFSMQYAVTENMEITLRSPRLSKAVFLPYNRNIISGFRLKPPNELATLYLTTARPPFRRIKKTYQHDDRLVDAPILTVKPLKDAIIQTNDGMNKLYIVPVMH